MTTTVGGAASSRAQISVASSGGASGSSRTTSPPDETHVEVMPGGQPASGVQSGWSSRQTQRPGATSRSSGVTPSLDDELLESLGVVEGADHREVEAGVEDLLRNALDVLRSHGVESVENRLRLL